MGFEPPSQLSTMMAVAFVSREQEVCDVGGREVTTNSGHASPLAAPRGSLLPCPVKRQRKDVRGWRGVVWIGRRGTNDKDGDLLLVLCECSRGSHCPRETLAQQKIHTRQQQQQLRPAGRKEKKRKHKQEGAKKKRKSREKAKKKGEMRIEKRCVSDGLRAATQRAR